MMTQTHILMAAAVYAKPQALMRTSLAIVGGFVPDLALTSLFLISRFNGVSEGEIFGKLFWSERWSAIMAPGNSFLVFGLLLSIGVWFINSAGKSKTFGALLVVFCVSALLHLVTDFFLHAEDARVQFWPVSEWVFYSPVSYWDARYFGTWVQPLELLLAIGCLGVLVFRFKGKITRSILGIVLILYIAMPVYFYLNHVQM